MKQVLVIGAARSGIAVAKLLLQEGFRVILSDKAKIPEKAELQLLGIQVVDNGHPQELWKKAYAFIVKNPGIPYSVDIIKYFMEASIPIYTEIEIAYRYAKKFHYAAITGTNGKTTITNMLHAMLQKKGVAMQAGNIGIPLSQIVLQHGKEQIDIALELSNFQLLGLEQSHFDVSTVCNLAPDHLDYMGTLDAYYRSKMKIYENAKQTDIFIRNIDDPLIIKYATNIPCQVKDISFESQTADFYRKNHRFYYKDIYLFDERELNVIGDFNIMNAMMAASMAYLMGVSATQIQAALSQFKQVEHRLEFFKEINGIQFYNDSKATNPHACAAALQAFKKPVILLAGGFDKKIALDQLKLYDNKVKVCVSFGACASQFLTIFKNVVPKKTMKDALNYAYEHAEKGDIIVLSPACASYDQFANYEQRGTYFKKVVTMLCDKGES